MTFSTNKDRILAEMFGTEGSPIYALLQDLAVRLRDLRLESDKSMRALAAEMQTSTLQIYAMEAGTHFNTTLRSFVNYADALGYRLEINLVPKELPSEGIESPG